LEQDHSWVSVVRRVISFPWGYLKGYDWYHNWHSTPVLYVDRKLNGNYYMWVLENTTVGQVHTYRVGEYTQNGHNTMFAMIDNYERESEDGYSSSPYQATGQTEVHDTSDHSLSHFYQMKAGLLWLQPNETFHDDAQYKSPPPPTFYTSLLSQSEWTTWD